MEMRRRKGGSDGKSRRWRMPGTGAVEFRGKISGQQHVGNELDTGISKCQQEIGEEHETRRAPATDAAKSFVRVGRYVAW